MVSVMNDIVLAALMAGFFFAAGLYARFCEKL